MRAARRRTSPYSFCVSALEEALARFGTPEIFNTDNTRHVSVFASRAAFAS